MPTTELVTLIVVGAVLLIGVVSSVSGRIGVAAPIVLVILGAGLGAIPGAEKIVVAPELILTVVLPPLLFAAARKVPFVDFRRNLRVILFLSIALVLVSALLVAAIVSAAWAPIPFALALALGAVVAPPDAVAATSLAKRIGLPPRIVTILEGEGLINDATALVLLSTALGIATAGTGAVSAGSIGLQFVWAVVGASVIGVVLGTLSVRLRQRISDAVLDTAITLAVPFVVYLAAELAGASGIVGVVAAGIVVGNTSPFRVPATLRIAEEANWRLSTIVLENGVFLYMGLQLWSLVRDVIQGPFTLPEVLGLGALITLAVVALRFAVMPGVLWAIRRRVHRTQRRYEQVGDRVQGLEERTGVAPDEEHGASRIERSERGRLARFRWWREVTGNDLAAERDQELGWREGVILGMAGMRGVVTVAAVQTLPQENDPYRSGLVLIAYLVALVTLLAQGLSLPAVVRRLHPPADTEPDERAEIAELRQKVLEAGRAEVERIIADPKAAVSAKVADALRHTIGERSNRIDELGSDPGEASGGVREFQRLRSKGLAAERAALRHERSRGGYSSEAVAFVGRTLDSDEMQLRLYSGDPAE